MAVIATTTEASHAFSTLTVGFLWGWWSPIDFLITFGNRMGTACVARGREIELHFEEDVTLNSILLSL